jgi:tetratricopeptide (TPR) repeat protein
MNRPGKGTVYSLTMIAAVGSLVLIGVLALSLMATGTPAFPVTVFGDPRTSDRVIALPAIRPAERAALPQGVFGLDQLLPLPAQPVWTTAEPRTAADSLYARAAGMGLQHDLDQAREAAQNGSRETALRLYDRLGARLPDDRTLLIERASVLTSFGEQAKALALLRPRLDRYPRDYELHMLAARNAWWAEQALTADTLVGQALALNPNDDQAVRLRETIRSTTTPPLAVARAWAASSNAPREQLTLARALVREGAYPEAIGSYRRALADPRLRTDSLILEAASAASAADSVQELDALTQQYLALHPNDAEMTLRLARAYSWRGDYAEALRNYDKLDKSDPALRLEVAQVLMWSGKEKEAERELRTVVAQRPNDAVAFKMLGDLASYRADWDASSAYYARAQAIDPSMAGLAEGIATAERGKEAVRLASLPRPTPDGTGATMEFYGDNQSFRWLSTHAERSFHAGTSHFLATVANNVFEGSPAGALSRNAGAALRVDGTFDLGRRGRLDLTAGGESYVSVSTFAVLGVGLTVFDLAGAQAAISYRHQPAAARAATFAALQARATSDVLALDLSKTRGAWTAAARGEGEHFASTVGGVNRWAGSASLSRALTPQLAASIGLSAQHVDGPSPVMPRFGNVVWAPISYVEPSVGLVYRASVRPGLNASVGTSFGYGFAQERANDQRFGSGTIPTGALTADLTAVRGPWTLSAGGNYGGALVRGFRAGLLRIQASYRMGP